MKRYYRIAKIYLIVFSIVFGFNSPLIAKDASQPDTENASQTEASQETKPRIDETQIFLNSNPETKQTTTESTSFFGSLWRFVLLLAIVCGLAYFVLSFIKKSQQSTADDPYLRVAASLKLSPNKVLYIILVKQEAFLISMTEKDIRLISKIEDTELIDSLNLAAENFSGQEISFQKLLNRLFTKGKKEGSITNSNTSDVNEPITTDFLANMRARLSEQNNQEE